MPYVLLGFIQKTKEGEREIFLALGEKNNLNVDREFEMLKTACLQAGIHKKSRHMGPTFFIALGQLLISFSCS